MAPTLNDEGDFDLSPHKKDQIVYCFIIMDESGISERSEAGSETKIRPR
jgi:hypothetical protein